jgi:predicted regulator of amino acid metabolism with ACT domain
MRTSEELNELSAALVTAQGELKDITKNKQGYGYMYATLESILAVTRPILAKNGLAVVQSHGNDANLITVTTRIIHKSGQWLEDTGGVDYQVLRNMNNAQSVGSAITYLRRYQISSFLNITSDEDVDGEPEKRQQRQGNSEKPTEETLSNYLASKGINAKNAKVFCKQNGIISAKIAKDWLDDKTTLNEAIASFVKVP